MSQKRSRERIDLEKARIFFKEDNQMFNHESIITMKMRRVLSAVGVSVYSLTDNQVEKCYYRLKDYYTSILNKPEYPRESPTTPADPLTKLRIAEGLGRIRPYTGDEYWQR